jgi:hypothetical protein
LNQDAILGESVSRELKQAKDSFQDLTFQLSACEDAKEKLIERLKTRLPVEVRAEIQVINDEIHPKLEEEQEVLFQRYTDALSKTIALYEALHGRVGKEYHREFTRQASDFRGEGESRLFFDAVAEARKEFGDKPLNYDRRQAAHKEQERLRNVLREDPDKAVMQLLQASGAKAFQPKQKQVALKDLSPGLAMQGGHTFSDPMEKISAAQYMGYEVIPPPKIEYSECMRTGHTFHDVPAPGRGRVCSRCGDPDRNWTPEEAPAESVAAA